MSEPTAANPPKRRKRWILRILGIGAILLAVLILAGPWVVANCGFRDDAINVVMASPSVTASSKSASFSWVSPLSVDGLQLKSSDDHIRVDVERLAADRSIFQLLLSAPDLGTITVDKPHAQLQLPLDVKPQGDRRIEPTFRAVVRDASLTVRAQGQDEPVMQIDGINVSLRVEEAEEGRVLTLDPVVLFDRRKLSPDLGNKLLYLLAPTLADVAPTLADVGAPQIEGEVSLSLDKCRIPLRVPRDQQAKQMEAEGKLTLHNVSTEVRNPILQALIELLADLYSKDASEVVRVVQDAEIQFQVRDGRLFHEGLRIGFPDIDPDLVISSRGSVGLDRTLDLHVDLPRLDRAKRKEKGPIKCHITGTLKNPKIAVQDASFVVRLPNHKEPIIDADGINLNLRVDETASGRVLTMEPVEIFKKEKLSVDLGAGLLKLIEPDLARSRQITGEISLSVDKVQIPLGVRGEQRLKNIAVEGKLTLHKVSTEVKNPIGQVLIHLLADLYGKEVSEDVLRVVQDAEIRFQVRDGRMFHEGFRFGIPEIDPELVIASRGSIGLDQTLDLHVDLPRLDRATRKAKAPAKCHITGTIKNPKIAIQDASLVVRLPNRKEPIIDADGINVNLRVEDTDTGRMLTMEPVDIFKKEKLTVELASGLLYLIEPDVAAARKITGEMSLSVDKLQIPLGVRGEQRLKNIAVEGKLTLHQLATEGRSPLRQAVIQLLADMYGKQASDVLRIVEDAEIRYQVRDGRLFHEGFRIGFPEIDPELVVKSRGSIGLDETLDLNLELPRLRKEKGPVQCHVTGTIRNPKVSVKDTSLVVSLSKAGKPLLDVGNINLTYSIEDTKDGRMLALAPVSVFKKLKVTPEVANDLLPLIAPNLAELAGVQGEISLSLDTFRIPLGVPKDQFVKRAELTGTLQLHDLTTTVKTQFLMTLVKVIADMHGKKPSEVVRVVNEAEIRFQLREGRLHHEGLRLGFPDISPKLLVSSKGSVGLDKSLDLILEVPRILIKLKKDPADTKNAPPVRLRVTGTIDMPTVTEIKEDKGK